MFEISNFLVYITISISISVTAALVAFYLKRSKYNDKTRQVELDQIRASLEKQMYVLNKQIIANEERWKEANHLLLADKSGNILRKELETKKNQNSFLKANGIYEEEISIKPKTVFVLTPFHSDFEDDYLAIKKVCSKVGLNCFRGDENYFSSDIFTQILKLITSSSLIIANINGRNPNVMYELGIAHALDKPVILISKSPHEIPIDLKSKRFIIYKNYSELREKLSYELIKVFSNTRIL